MPESEFDTVRRGLAPDQVASYLKRVATSVLSLEARLSDTTSELLETRRERDNARAELEAASAARDPYVNVSDQVTGLVRSFDHQMSGLLRDAEAEAERVRSEVRIEADRILAHAQEEAERIVEEAEEEADRTRADARLVEEESRMRAGRLMLEARQEADQAESHLATLRGTMLDTFRDIRERTRAALGEVEAVIESEATSDRLVIVDDAAGSSPGGPSGGSPDRICDPRPDDGRCDRGSFGNLCRRAEEDPQPTARQAARAAPGRAPAAAAQAPGDDDRGRTRDRARGWWHRLLRVRAGGDDTQAGASGGDGVHGRADDRADRCDVEPEDRQAHTRTRGGRLRRHRTQGGHQAEAAVLGAQAGREAGDDLHGGDADLVRHDRDRAPRRPGAADGQLVRVPRAEGLLRRAAVPPARHVDRRDPGGRSDRDRLRAARATRSPTSSPGTSPTGPASSRWPTPGPTPAGASSS